MTNFSSSPPIAFGDLQGCHAAYRQLFDTLAPAADTPLWFAGDLVNRGPASLATLREIVALGERAIAVLGNHDLHLLAVAAGIRTLKPGDTIGEILDAPDADDLIEWVRHRPFAHFERGMLMVHAGLLPQWDARSRSNSPTNFSARCARRTGATRCAACTATTPIVGARI